MTFGEVTNIKIIFLTLDSKLKVSNFKHSLSTYIVNANIRWFAVSVKLFVSRPFPKETVEEVYSQQKKEVQILI